jgi:hypothetical protein
MGVPQVANDTLTEMSQQGEQMKTANSKVKDINHNLTQNFGKKKLFKKFRQSKTPGSGGAPDDQTEIKKLQGQLNHGNLGAGVGTNEVLLATEGETEEDFLDNVERNDKKIDGLIDGIGDNLANLDFIAQKMDEEAKAQSVVADELMSGLDETDANLEKGHKKIKKIRRGGNCTIA